MSNAEADEDGKCSLPVSGDGAEGMQIKGDTGLTVHYIAFGPGIEDNQRVVDTLKAIEDKRLTERQ